MSTFSNRLNSICYGFCINRTSHYIVFLSVALISPLGCSNQQRFVSNQETVRASEQKEQNSLSVAGLASGEALAPTPEEAQRKLGEMGDNWLYGYGMGRTAVNIGAIVLFPPYAIYVLGNAALQVAGEDPLYLTDALPDAPREAYLNAYDGVTGTPGRLSAALAGVPFHDGSN